MRRFAVRISGSLLPFLFLACGDDPTHTIPIRDAAEEYDAGFLNFDASPVDTGDPGLADAGTPLDLGFADASAPADSGTAVDAGIRDAASPDASPIDTGVSDTGVNPTDSGWPDTGGPSVLNPNWIGGPCSQDSDCSFTGGRCLTEAQGYPGGMCIKDCDRLCPDLAGPQNSVTFCVDTEGDGAGLGQCISRCDFTLSPTGCRNGYACVPEGRMNQDTTIRSVCMPTTGFPGRPEPAFDIGAACTSASDCNRNSCAGLPGGYCTQEACNLVGCPTGSTCFNIGSGEESYICLKNCSTGSDCRMAENFTCDADNTCWYQPPPDGDCNLTPGPSDCSPYASGATSDFVVVTKHQRRLTLCNGSTAAASFCMGLGWSPVGDKEREGDGRTPEGRFYVARTVPASSFYKAFLVSYPGVDDAARGLAAGLITQSEHDAIVAANSARREPPQNTALGGLIEIHGSGGTSDWTAGCMALDNINIDRLWSTLGTGDDIFINP